MPKPWSKKATRPVKFGDLLRYPKDQDGTPPNWVFMFIAYVQSGYVGEDFAQIVVVRAPDDDDFMAAGMTILAGRDEMIPLP